MGVAVGPLPPPLSVGVASFDLCLVVSGEGCLSEKWVLLQKV